VFYVHTDQLNTPRKVSRPSDNALRWKWDPTPFGEGAPDQNPASIGTFVYNLRFPGQQFDLETNLNYNYFRDYDPSVGRYTTSDPIGLVGGSASTYGYVGGDPLRLIDPLGLNSRALTRVLPWAGGAAAVDGPIPIGDVLAILAIGGAVIYDVCAEDEDEIDCQEWLDLLNAEWALLSINSKGPFDKLAEKELHDQSVDLFCTQCPELCNQARRFGKVTLQ
jgi:RHS repeat-associated protein